MSLARSAESPRLFKNPVLERFSHVHPAVPALFWIPVIAGLLYRSVMVHGLPAWSYVALGLGGLLAWTFFEYVLHRFVFHARPRSPSLKRMVYVFHGIHHDHPNDWTRLVMPPVPGVAICLVAYLPMVAVLGIYSEAFLAFFLIGYLVYDYTHLYVHFAQPKRGWGKFIKQYHMVHHYAEHDAKWGVSTPIWDFVFGTSELEKKKPIESTLGGLSS
jgi:dihydroceramide fatty acyl 2-hydroxylase